MYNCNYCRDSKQRIRELESRVHIVNEFPKVTEVKGGTVLPRKTGTGQNTQIPYQGIGGVVSSTNEFIKESVIYDLRIDNNKDRIAFGGDIHIRHLVRRIQLLSIWGSRINIGVTFWLT